MRYEYANEIASLKSKMIGFGKTVTSILEDTLTAIREIDFSIAERVMSNDSNINGNERDIESECIRVISLQRPFASDLRLMTGYLKLVLDLKRIFDHCKDSCEIILSGNVSEDSICKDQVISVLEQSYKMLVASLEACFALDVSTAKEIYKLDDSVDTLFSNAIKNISSSISEKLISVYTGTDLMFIVKYAERIGDRCVNIAQWTVYMAEGFFPDRNYFE